MDHADYDEAADISSDDDDTIQDDFMDAISRLNGKVELVQGPTVRSKLVCIADCSPNQYYMSS